MLLEEYENAEALLNSTGTALAIVKKRKFAFKEITADKKKDPDSWKEGVMLSKPFAKPINQSNSFLLTTSLYSITASYSLEKDRTFALIEYLGDNYAEQHNWVYSTCIKVIRYLTIDDIETYNYEYFIHLAEVKRIQQLNPFIHVGGSAGLFLHGIKLNRIKKGAAAADIDVCGPFYQPIIGSETDTVEYLPDETRSDEADFKEVVSFNGVTVDYRIDPKERFEYIKYKGFDYRVTPLEVIMEAKFRYAMKGSVKHKEDCYDICGKQKPVTPATPVYSAPPDDIDDLDWL